MADQEEDVTGTEMEVTASELANAIGPALIKSQTFLKALANSPAFITFLQQNPAFMTLVANQGANAAGSSIPTGLSR